MKKQKKWYDYLWIVSAAYLILGFFNILFAWLGLICFFVPLGIAFVKGNKSYCNRYCGRGQLFELLGGKFGLSRNKPVPNFLKQKWFRYAFLTFFMMMFANMLFTTYLVFAKFLRSARGRNITLDIPFAMAICSLQHSVSSPVGCTVCLRIL